MKPFVSLKTGGAIGYSGGNERATSRGTDRGPVPTCKAFVRTVVVLVLALYRVYGTAVF